MTLIDTLLHLLNFATPALAVSLLVGLLGYFWMKKTRFRLALWQVVVINFIVCLVVLLMGLWLFGRDGKMLTYFGMALACGTCQWVLGRGWRN